MEILIISGLSGAGKSRAAICLEDGGYYIVDNLPAEMMVKFAEFCEAAGGRYDRLAFVYDVRAGEPFQRLTEAVDEIRAKGLRCRLLFLEADTKTIINRYKETRRSHPLCGDGCSIEDAVARERAMLEPVRSRADLVLDTSTFSTAKLRSTLLNQEMTKVSGEGIVTSSHNNPEESMKPEVLFDDVGTRAWGDSHFPVWVRYTYPANQLVAVNELSITSQRKGMGIPPAHFAFFGVRNETVVVGDHTETTEVRERLLAVKNPFLFAGESRAVYPLSNQKAFSAYELEVEGVTDGSDTVAILQLGFYARRRHFCSGDRKYGQVAASEVARTELQPCAMFANGPPCMMAGVPSIVCTRFGLMASLSKAVIAPSALMSFA